MTRTPEKAFENVVESQGNLNYVYIEHGGQKLRVHYVDQGHRNGKVRDMLRGVQSSGLNVVRVVRPTEIQLKKCCDILKLNYCKQVFFSHSIYLLDDFCQ